MSKAAKKPKPVKRSWRSVRSLFAVAGTLAVVVGLLFVLNRVGNEAQDHVGPRERYEVPFAEIECATPQGLERSAFLAEVRKASGFPETFQLLDPATPEKLRAAFASHPWVDAVEDVTISPQKPVQVKLVFRVPVLVVHVEGSASRLVDGKGVLLPQAVPTAELAELVNVVPPPKSPEGKPWADETVKRAVELVKSYHPRRLEKTTQGWRLNQPDGRVLLVGW